MAETQQDFHLEIAHVLFMDIVGYSKLLINEQAELLQELNRIVRNTSQFRNAEAAGELIRLPSGDGMALVFLRSAEAPVQCAIEISQALRSSSEIRLRMGVHSGPVNQVTDVNDRSNLAGAGINIAQRVMDCGDAGHILLSKRAADDLAHYRQWQSGLHDLGEFEVKHGVRVHIVNLCSDDVGNSTVPEKLKQGEKEMAAVVSATAADTRRQKTAWIVAALAAIALAIGFWAFWHGGPQKPVNATGENPSSAVERAIALNPNSSFAHFAYGHVLSDLGRHKEAIAEMAQAKELDPVFLLVRALEGMFFHHARRDVEASACLQSALELDPNFWITHLTLGKVYIQQRKYPEAISELTKAKELSHGNSEAIGSIGYVNALMADKAKARAVLEELKTLSDQHYIPPVNIALVYNGLGERDEALSLLERACDERDVRLTLLKVDPRWDSFRGNPRFVAILKRIGLQ
jgi:tetratricopeptide (TPR) repeat protein